MSAPACTFPELIQRAESDDGGIRRIPVSELTSSARAYLSDRRAEIRARHDEGASGEHVVRAMSALADEIVRGIIEIGLCREKNAAAFKKRVSVCALGGYGRQQLNPFSDLDIAFISKRKADRHVDALNRFLVPFLWDIGYENSCVVRTVKECVTLAREDTRVFTGLFDSRLVMGAKDPLLSVQMAVFNMRPSDIPERFQELLSRANESSYQNRFRDLYAEEPNVKENPGGLRDMHCAHWLYGIHTGARTIDGLRGLGYLSGEEQLGLLAALDFQWRVRNELHFSFEKAEDRLTYENATRVAVALGYTDASRGERTRLMEDYYAAARRVRRFLEAAVGECRGSAAPKRRKAADTSSRELDVRDGYLEVVVEDPQWFDENPSRLMSVIWECARRDVPLGHRTARLIRSKLDLVGETFQSSELVRRFFIAICNRPLVAGRALRQAAECGLLDVYLPEFAAVKDIIRYEDFHHYPVEEHTIRAVEALATIPEMNGPVGSFLNVSLEHMQDPYILVLALVCHDLGKVEGEEHSVAGMHIARTLCQRIGLPQEDEDRIAFLVEQHLLMTQIALYRDIDDEEVVRRFAETMKSEERLKALFLLSFADMSAVGPNVWTEWKGTLLLNLYLNAERMLMGRTGTPDEAYWLQPKADAVRSIVGDEKRDAVEPHLRDMGGRYFATFTAEQIAVHMECLAEAEGPGLSYRIVNDKEAGITNVIVCTRDHPGLFEEIAGCFAAQLVDVESAAAFTRADGLVLDTFVVASAERRASLTSAKVKALERTVTKVLADREDVREHISKARNRIFGLQQDAPAVPTRIAFDNDTSSDRTIIDIESGDRTGLLFDIVSAMSENRLDIASARIVTDARRVRDAFYVTRNNEKLLNPDEQETLNKALIAAIHMRPGVETQGGAV